MLDMPPVDPATAALSGAKADDGGGAKPRVQSVARAIDVLTAVAQASASGISAKDISDRLSLSRQLVYHMLHTLSETGMVRKQSGSRYVLGIAAATVAEGLKRQMRAGDLLGEYVNAAALTTGETAYVSGWVDNDIVVRACAPGHSAVRAGEVSIGVGGHAHCRASGKLLLAMLPEGEARRYLAMHAIERMTVNSIVTLRDIDAELDRVRRRWVGVEYEEFFLGLGCIAVPLGEPPCGLVLAISAPIDRFRAQEETYLSQLRAVTRQIF